MLYPILQFSTVGTPLQMVERNLAIDPTVGPVSSGIVFLVAIGNTGFFTDQQGRLYYDADGEPKKSCYSN